MYLIVQILKDFDLILVELHEFHAMPWLTFQINLQIIIRNVELPLGLLAEPQHAHSQLVLLLIA